MKIELVVETQPIDAMIGAGEVGDGKMFISEIQDAVRIRRGERDPGSV